MEGEAAVQKRVVDALAILQRPQLRFKGSKRRKEERRKTSKKWLLIQMFGIYKFKPSGKKLSGQLKRR